MGIFGLGKKTSEKELEARLKKLTVVCPKCKAEEKGKHAFSQLFVCEKCGAYMTIGARERIHMVVDKGSFEPWFNEEEESNPLNHAEYPDKLKAAREKSGNTEAVTVGKAKLGGYDVVIGACDANFMMGSMGRIMGERITKAFEQATEMKLPVFLFCCSGGARMQEGIVSLMQMEKTSAAVKRHSNAGLLYCAVLTDPTMGGVTASFAMLGDIILAEPGARIGFAGPRVIQQTIRQTLPQGFQTAEFLLQHGMIDGIVERKELRDSLIYIAKTHLPEESYKIKGSIPVASFNDQLAEKQKKPWEKIKMCRSRDRASTMDYISHIFTDFRELHGDRLFADDQAMVGGLAFFGDRPVTVIGEVRGKSLEESVKRNFGMPKPEGYRKAVRLMKQAEKFKRPIITFINTPGAFCGIDAEERGQGEAIARSIMEMSDLKTPVLCVLIGEGGSGGALATAVGNKVWMMENSTYAILSPEGYSAILYKTEERAEEAAKIMKLTAQDMYDMRIIDRIIPELGGANDETIARIAENMKVGIKEFIMTYQNMSREEIVEDRYQRFRKF